VGHLRGGEDPVNNNEQQRKNGEFMEIHLKDSTFSRPLGSFKFPTAYPER